MKYGLMEGCGALNARKRAEFWRKRAVEHEMHSNSWEKRYQDEHDRVVALAKEHLPRLDVSNEDDLPGIDKTISLFHDHQPVFVCSAKDCPFHWPCPTYLWATGSKKFTVKIEADKLKANIEIEPEPLDPPRYGTTNTGAQCD